jgi:uncharacterized membrane protein YraQ (UPF0718 family)/copper chaperone CopZ
MWAVLSEMSIYLILGFLIAGILSVAASRATIEKHLGGKGLMSIVKATLIGVPLPLCSCGVIPVATSMLKHGASKGATISFLISTPETGIDSILVTYSLLGGVFAVFRPMVAAVSGFVAGVLVNLFGDSREGKEHKVQACQGDCCNLERSKRHWVYRIFHHGFVVLPADIGKSLMVGILVAGLIAVFVPADYFSQTFMSGGIGAMLVMILVGIPSYVCASASVPMAMALIAKGVSPGAALVFLITGPATNAAAIATIWKIMGGRTTGIYLLTVAVMALAAGLLLDQIFMADGVKMVSLVTGEGLIPEYIKNIGTVIFLSVLAGPGIYRKCSRKKIETELDRTGETIIFGIEGMCCPECAESVENVLLQSPGVKGVSVDLHCAQARVVGRGFDTGELQQKITGLGFTAKVREATKERCECEHEH